MPAAGSADADKFLFDRGTEALTKKRWLEAREYFRRLVDTYPQSPYRAEAKLGLGDSYIGQNTVESNILAINEFHEFLTFFPLSDRADYAQYRIGLAHFRQMLSPQRDQTATREALAEFDAFLQRYPTSKLRPEVENLQRQARDRLSQSEFEIGLLYSRMKWCPGAVERFKGLLAQDPGYTARDGVYYYLGECLERLKRPAEALPYYDRLVTEFPKSKYVEDAKKRIAVLKK
jgi:outer membrane protein assembly factor BamD